MELCPVCGFMSAEINHYNGLLICYNKSCNYIEQKKEKKEKNNET